MPGQDDPNPEYPYKLEIQAPEVMLTQVGGITLAGNQAIMMRFAGVALDPGDGDDYATITLTNEVPTYTWPT
jgi:hypothetical protein